MAHIVHRPVVPEVATLLLVGDTRTERMKIEVIGRGQLRKLRSCHLSSNDASGVVIGVPHHRHAGVNGRGRQRETQCGFLFDW